MTDGFRVFACWCAAVGGVQVVVAVAKAVGAIDTPWPVVLLPLWLPSFVIGGSLVICWVAHAVATRLARAVSGR